MSSLSTKIYLFRHGRSAANEVPGYVWGRCVNSSLAATGVSEALRLGTYLRRHAVVPNQVFASPTVRARRTADLAMAWACPVPVIANDPRLHEQDVGLWAGRPVDEVFTSACLRDIEYRGKDFRPPDGESMNDVAQRMVSWLLDLPRTEDYTAFAFTHGGAVRALASALHNLPHAQAYPIQPPTSSVSLLLACRQESWRFSYIGCDPADALTNKRGFH